MNGQEFAMQEQQWQNRCMAELKQAPEKFLQAFGWLQQEDYETAARYFGKCVDDDIWRDTSLAILAFIYYSHGQYEPALTALSKCTPANLGRNGRYYYFHVLGAALNQMDRLAEALAAAEAAIEFFDSEKAPGALANHYFRKANVLKQLAAKASRSADDEVWLSAREYSIEALKSTAASLAIVSDGWEEDIAPELENIARIAARSAVGASDLGFLDGFAEIRPIMDKFLEPFALSRKSVSECFNMAQQEKRDGKRPEAAIWFDRAVEACPEDSAWDRAFKAFISYQAGVNLLKWFQLDDGQKLKNLNDAERRAVADIQRHWQRALDLYKALDTATVSEFDDQFPPGITSAAWNISRDPLMAPEYMRGF